MTARRSLRRRAGIDSVVAPVPKQPHKIAPSSAEADALTTGGSSQRRREVVRPGGAEVAEKDLDLVVERGDGSVLRFDNRVREDVVP